MTTNTTIKNTNTTNTTNIDHVSIWRDGGVSVLYKSNKWTSYEVPFVKGATRRPIPKTVQAFIAKFDGIDEFVRYPQGRPASEDSAPTTEDTTTETNITTNTYRNTVTTARSFYDECTDSFISLADLRKLFETEILPSLEAEGEADGLTFGGWLADCKASGTLTPTTTFDEAQNMLASCKAMTDTPEKTVKAFIEWLDEEGMDGYKEAVSVIATMVAIEAWDGRISRANAEWGKRFAMEYDPHRDYVIDRIHRAHLDQIADAMQEEMHSRICAALSAQEAEASEPPCEDDTYTVTVPERSYKVGVYDASGDEIRFTSSASFCTAEEAIEYADQVIEDAISAETVLKVAVANENEETIYQVTTEEYYEVDGEEFDNASSALDEFAERIVDDPFEFGEWLDEVYGDIEVCGYTYLASVVFEKVDPIAFRCSCSDWADTERSDMEYDLDRADIGEEVERYGVTIVRRLRPVVQVAYSAPSMIPDEAEPKRTTIRLESDNMVEVAIPEIPSDYDLLPPIKADEEVAADATTFIGVALCSDPEAYTVADTTEKFAANESDFAVAFAMDSVKDAAKNGNYLKAEVFVVSDDLEGHTPLFSMTTLEAYVPEGYVDECCGLAESHDDERYEVHLFKEGEPQFNTTWNFVGHKHLSDAIEMLERAHDLFYCDPDGDGADADHGFVFDTFTRTIVAAKNDSPCVNGLPDGEVDDRFCLHFYDKNGNHLYKVAYTWWSNACGSLDYSLLRSEDGEAYGDIIDANSGEVLRSRSNLVFSIDGDDNGFYTEKEAVEYLVNALKEDSSDAFDVYLDEVVPLPSVSYFDMEFKASEILRSIVPEVYKLRKSEWANIVADEIHTCTLGCMDDGDFRSEYGFTFHAVKASKR